MLARPVVLVLAVIAIGVVALSFVEASLPVVPYVPAGFAAAVVFVTTVVLLRGIRTKHRISIAGAATGLGFFAGAALTIAPHPWLTAFAAAWLPLFVMLFAGIGGDRLTHELVRLEDECDDPKRRPGAIARAIAIRDDAARSARGADPNAATEPRDPNDPRAVYAYAAQVVAYAYALDERYAEALASLDPVPRRWMMKEMRGLMMANLAFWRLCTGEIELAKKEMDAAIDPDPLPEARPIVRAVKAAVFVWSDRPDDALELVGREADPTEPAAQRARYAIVRAHALAVKGDDAAARAAIADVLDEPAGEQELRQWLPAGGPAAKLLRERLEAGAAAARAPREPANESA